MRRPRHVGVGVAQVDDPVDPGVDLGGDEVRVAVVVEQSEDRRDVVDEQLVRGEPDGRRLVTEVELVGEQHAVLAGMVDGEPDVRLAVGAERASNGSVDDSRASASASRKLAQQYSLASRSRSR